jgi:hypothetical protein
MYKRLSNNELIDLSIPQYSKEDGMCGYLIESNNKVYWVYTTDNTIICNDVSQYFEKQ